MPRIPRREASDDGTGRAPVSHLRKWLFRLTAAFLVPILFLLALEGVLRVAGVGYSTSFFRKAQIQGREAFVENDQFGFRFFPPEAARTPAPIVLPMDKPPGTYRIFILGESAALGDPKPAFGFGRYLQVLLNARYPGNRFEVIAASMTGINSHALLPIARECAEHDGDVWVIYMGNNELAGPFGAGGAFGSRSPNLAMVRASLAFKKTRVGQLLDTIGRQLGATSDMKTWRGLKTLASHQVAPGDASRRRTEQYFEKNLREILELAARAGVKVVLCTVGSNLKDCAPFASMHPSTMTEPERERWDKLYQDGAAAAASGKPEAALDAFSQASKIDPFHAELQFRIGQFHQAQTNLTLARESYERARDFDALPVRTTSALNAVVKRTAEGWTNRGVILLDAAEMLNRDSDAGIAGDEVFLDHVHLGFDSNYRLARALGEQVSAVLTNLSADAAGGTWLTPVQCDLQLALTDWNRFVALEGMLMRFADAPYTNQLNHAARRNRYRAKLAELRTQLREADKRLIRGVYEAAIKGSGQDHYLRQNYAEFLETSGDLTGAVEQWRQIQGLLPHHPVSFYQAGRLLVRLGKYPEAEKCFSEALLLRGDFPAANAEMGIALAKQGKPAAAVDQYRKALQADPGDPVLQFQMADALAAAGRRAEAIEHLREAVRQRPGYWEARYLLGVELAVLGKLSEAEVQFAEAVRLRPDFALAHLNLGVALARTGRLSEAKTQFNETLRLDPTNRAAQAHLDSILAIQRGTTATP